MGATVSLGSPPTNTISAPSGTFTSGGVNSGGQLGSSGASAIAQALGGGAGGPPSSDQMQALTSRLGAMNLNPNDMSAMGHALGLNDQQVSQIQQNIQASRQPAAPGMSPPPSLTSPQQPSAPSGVGSPTAPGSMIEAKFQQLDNPLVTVSPPTSSNLTQFGYSAFMSPVSTFAPTQNVPITDDYMLGPGDQLVVFTWGRVNAQLQLQVQSDGSVLIDQVGPLQVAGLTFGQARKLIEGRLKQSTGTEVNVTMGQLRSIQVTVVGEVNQPGTYTVSALSRLSNALLAAGGPSKTGSLRRIELRRGGRQVGTLDLYDVLLKGDTRADVQLQQGDVIRVPIIGAVVGVAGDVKRPAIFELEDGPERLGEVVDRLAGGVTAFSYNGHLQVERIKNHEQVAVLDVPVQKMKQRDFEIKDGDLIKIFTVLPYHNNTVTLAGNVFRPGEYQWHKAMKVADLVNEGQGVLPHTYFKYALIKRLEGPQRYTHFVQVDLAAALSGNSVANLYLQNHDEVDIYSLDQLRDMPTVNVGGAVRLPGQYLLSERMRVSDLIYLAGGLKEDAYQPRAALVRVSVVKGHSVHRSFDLNLTD
ncbi:MAG: SLBB domain-containing protein, partial [Candidatus Binataceae bacterium]